MSISSLYNIKEKVANKSKIKFVREQIISEEYFNLLSSYNLYDCSFTFFASTNLMYNHLIKAISTCDVVILQDLKGNGDIFSKDHFRMVNLLCTSFTAKKIQKLLEHKRFESKMSIRIMSFSDNYSQEMQAEMISKAQEHPYNAKGYFHNILEESAANIMDEGKAYFQDIHRLCYEIQH